VTATIKANKRRFIYLSIHSSQHIR